MGSALITWAKSAVTLELFDMFSFYYFFVHISTPQRLIPPEDLSEDETELKKRPENSYRNSIISKTKNTDESRHQHSQ